MMNQMPFGVPNQNFMPMPNFNQNQNSGALEQTITNLEQKINSLDARLKNIENKLNIKTNTNPNMNNPYDYQSSMYMM